MKKITFSILTIFAILFLAPQFATAQLKQERIKASYLVAIGRLPTDAELNWWGQQNDYTVAQLVEAHRNYMNNTNKGSKADPIKQSYFIAMGRTPSTGARSETEYWTGRNEVAWEMVLQHVNYINQNKQLYDGVINNAYQKVFSKSASASEIAKWKNGTVRSFVELVYLLFNNPPAGYTVNPLAILEAMNTYKDFASVSFSDPVVQEIAAITSGNDLFSKFKNGIR